MNVWDIASPEPAITYAELLLLYEAVIETNSQIVVELGVETGNSTLALLAALEHTDGVLFSYDIDPCERAHERAYKHNVGSRWMFRQQHSLKTGWRGPIDVLWIDSSHEYTETMEELSMYEPWVRPGGIIAMHDIVSVQDVPEAILAHFGPGYDTTWHKLEPLHANGLAIIRKGRGHGEEEKAA